LLEDGYFFCAENAFLVAMPEAQQEIFRGVILKFFSKNSSKLKKISVEGGRMF